MRLSIFDMHTDRVGAQADCEAEGEGGCDLDGVDVVSRQRLRLRIDIWLRVLHILYVSAVSYTRYFSSRHTFAYKVPYVAATRPRDRAAHVHDGVR